MSGFETIALVLGGISTAASMVGQINQGKAAKQAANYKAQQMEANAGQERAASQRGAIEQRRKAMLMQSRAQAVGAASGSLSDPSTVNILGDLAGEGELGALTALYQGEARARGYEAEATTSRYEGNAAKKAGQAAAIGTGLSFFGKYGSSMMGSGGGFDSSMPTSASNPAPITYLGSNPSSFWG
jgi:hypothetical protein